MLREGDVDGVPQPSKPPETSETSGHSGEQLLPLVTSCAFETQLGQEKHELDLCSSLKPKHHPAAQTTPLPSHALTSRMPGPRHCSLRTHRAPRESFLRENTWPGSRRTLLPLSQHQERGEERDAVL